MSGVQSLNANAEVMGRQAALFMNINAAKGLEDVMKTNLGPKGTLKMLVSGAGGALNTSPARSCTPQLDQVSARTVYARISPCSTISYIFACAAYGALISVVRFHHFLQHLLTAPWGVGARVS